jgi:DNA-binding MarR family transcriptional regulator
MNFIDEHPRRRAFLANTLERLASVIVAQGDELLRHSGIDFPSRAVSTVMMLGERPGLSAADIAKVLDQPHQLVTQRIELLVEAGIIARIEDEADARRKRLALTARGKRQYEALRRLIERMDRVFSDLFRELECDLSVAAGRALASLRQSPLLERLS